MRPLKKMTPNNVLLTITVELKTTFCSTMVVLHTCSRGLPAKQGARPRRRAQWAGLWCQWLWTRGRRCWRCSRWWWCTLRHSRRPRVQRSQAAEWEQPKPGSQAQRKVLMAAPVPVPGGPVPAEVVEGGAEPGGGITSNSIWNTTLACSSGSSGGGRRSRTWRGHLLLSEGKENSIWNTTL